MTVVLVVDDEPAIRRSVSAGLSARDYEVRTASTGEEALASVAADPPDLVILDLGLPDLDGVDVCRRLRQWTQVPIVVLSAEASDYRKVLALDEGADDYVTKPFSMPELLARVRVALRHRTVAPGQAEATELVVGDLTVDLARHRVTVDGREVELTPKEFDFLALLARWPGPRADAPRHPPGRVGTRVRARDALPARVREPAAKEAPRRSQSTEAGDRTGGRLPAERRRRGAREPVVSARSTRRF